MVMVPGFDRCLGRKIILALGTNMLRRMIVLQPDLTFVLRMPSLNTCALFEGMFQGGKNAKIVLMRSC